MRVQREKENKLGYREKNFLSESRMAPADVEIKREASGKGSLCCALPSLRSLPKLPQLTRELDGCLCAITHVHSLLFDALENFKDSLVSNIREAAQKHPLLLRLLPPQILAPYFPQMKDSTRKQHPLALYNFAAALPGDSVALSVVSNGVLNFLNIYNTLLVVRLLLTWFPQPPQVIVNPLSTICDPYLNIFRGIIPPLGGTIDLSPILAFLVLNVFTNSAAALPAELQNGQGGSAASHQHMVSSVASTHAQKAWIRRLAACLEANKARV